MRNCDGGNSLTVDNEREKILKLMLIRIGIKCDFVGFTYLLYSVEFVIDQPNLLHDFHTLFSKVAERCGLESAFRVEANIQNAIKYTHLKKGFGAINELFGMEVLRPNYKPMTAELIKLCAEYYHMGLYKQPISFRDGHITVLKPTNK